MLSFPFELMGRSPSATVRVTRIYIWRRVTSSTSTVAFDPTDPICDEVRGGDNRGASPALRATDLESIDQGRMRCNKGAMIREFFAWNVGGLGDVVRCSIVLATL
jgi:hypothetical protein